MSCASASPCSGGSAIQRAARGRVLRDQLALEIERREIALADRIAGFRRQRSASARPARRPRATPRPFGEAGADIVLRARHAGMGQRPPDRERPRIVAAFAPRRRPPPSARRRRRCRCCAAGSGARHPAPPRHRAPARLATKPASSSRQRRSRTKAPSATRPITGTGRLRNAAASAVSARPCPRDGRWPDGDAGAGHRLERQAPEPIWLAQSTIST